MEALQRLAQKRRKRAIQNRWIHENNFAFRDLFFRQDVLPPYNAVFKRGFRMALEGRYDTVNKFCRFEFEHKIFRGLMDNPDTDNSDDSDVQQ